MKGNRQSIRYWLFPFIITSLERMNKELTSYDKIATVLFKGHEEAASLLSCRELMQKDRWMLCVSKLLEDPMTADKDLIAFLMPVATAVVSPYHKPPLTVIWPLSGDS